MTVGRDQLVRRLIRAGALEILGEDRAEADSYFNTNAFRFHGPDGFEADYAGLTAYFRSIRRGIVVAEGDFIACRTWIEGRFVRESSACLPPAPSRPTASASSGIC